MAKDMSGGMLSRSRELQEAREEDIRRDEALRAVPLEIASLKEENPIPSEKVQEELAELERQREMFQNMQMGFEKATTDREGKAEGGKFPDLTGDGKVTQADILKGRGVFAEGSLMMPAEGMPVDTYPNIPADEMDEAIASQLPDNEMEEDYIKYVMDESLSDEEQDYLAEALTKDSRLEDILDKVLLTATEFSGAGEVEGPGTGVSDSIPARLSDGEFVFTKKATDQIGADNLQRMMDDAERAFDGGYQMKAVGGMMDEEDPGMSQTQEEIEKLMIGANRMPSLQ